MQNLNFKDLNLTRMKPVHVRWQGQAWKFPKNRLGLIKLELWTGRNQKHGWCLYMRSDAINKIPCDISGNPVWISFKGSEVRSLGEDPVPHLRAISNALSQESPLKNSDYPPLHFGGEVQWTRWLSGKKSGNVLRDLLIHIGMQEPSIVSVKHQPKYTDPDCRDRIPDILIRLANGEIALVEAQSGAGNLDEWHFLKSKETYPNRLIRDDYADPKKIHVIILCGNCNDEYFLRALDENRYASFNIIRCRWDGKNTHFF